MKRRKPRNPWWRFSKPIKPRQRCRYLRPLPGLTVIATGYPGLRYDR